MFPCPQPDLSPPSLSHKPQVGNAVAPPMAAALGRCLLVAITATLRGEGSPPVDQPVISTPDPDIEEVGVLGMLFYGCQKSLA